MVMPTYLEIDSSFSSVPSGGLLLALDYAAVASSIDNILRTMRGERVMLPEFGSDIDGVLFDNIDEMMADRISDSIKESITVWDPRVTVVGVTMTPNYDSHYMEVQVQFRILGIQQTFTYIGTIQQ